MRRKLAIALLILLGTVLVAAGAVAGFVWWEARSVVQELHAGPKTKIVKAVEPVLMQKPKKVLVKPPPPVAGQQTILLIGSDHGHGRIGARSDTAILVRIDPKHNRLRLLSIPRDLYVEIPGHGHDRINMAFQWGGEKLLTRTVRDTLGVKIDHFVEIDFAGFKKIVHDLGGLWLPIDQRYFNQNLHTPGSNYAAINLRPGYQKLNGGQALEFARYRHFDSDFYRAARQQLVIREALRESLKDKLNLLKMIHLAHDFADATTSDIDGVRELWGLANAVRGARVQPITIDATDMTLYGAAYLSADQAQLRTAVRELYGLPAHAPSSAVVAAVPAPVRTPASTQVALYPDVGRAAALLQPLDPRMRRCVPTALPPGYGWPYHDAARAYVLDGHPAIAMYATSASGHSVLWMFTTWSDPPILDNPSATRRAGGRTLDLYTDSGHLRQIAWNVGPTRVWITNTLRNELTNAQMLVLATSCRVP
jgi:polyisoprenyl-teichoic acid--peptidoglycan teichoic acid transferase